MTKSKIFRAFSIIELSISILVIAVIMSVVAGSIKMVTSARLTNARSITSRSPVSKFSGLVAWYETSRLESFKPSEAIDGGQISSWYDVNPSSIAKQYNTLTRTASSAVTYQLSGINNIPSVYFNGTGKISVSSFQSGVTTQNTIFFVVKPYVADGNGNVIDSGSTSSVAAVALIASGLHSYWGQSGDQLTTLCCKTNENYIVAFYANGAYSRFYLNDATNMVNGSNVNPGSNLLTGLTIGADRNNTFNFNGLVSEVIIYNRPLQTPERKDVMSYLSQKYNITISGI